MMVPYVQGSSTSAQAADSKAETAASDEERVLEFIRSRGTEGATDWEVESTLHMLHQNASARRNGLVKKGVVCDSGITRKTATGRDATVWIVGEGEALVGAENDRVSRPSKEELKIAFKNIRMLAEHSRTSKGPAVLDELQKVGKWLAWIARH